MTGQGKRKRSNDTVSKSICNISENYVHLILYDLICMRPAKSLVFKFESWGSTTDTFNQDLRITSYFLCKGCQEP